MHARTLVIDWKGLIKWHGYKRYATLRKFTASDAFRKIYAPNLQEIDNPAYWNAFFKYGYLHKNCQVYVDETSAVTRNSELPPYYRHILARGRERNIRLLSSTQRPVAIPAIVLTEAEHLYCFRLNRETDRERIEKNAGVLRTEISALKTKEHKFFYASEDEILGPIRLKIKERD